VIPFSCHLFSQRSDTPEKFAGTNQWLYEKEEKQETRKEKTITTRSVGFSKEKRDLEWK
jgi:hypothetical protein